MESSHSCLSSLEEEVDPVYVQPHYKESYRLAIYALLCGGREAYDHFLKAEQISPFLSEEEILFILRNAELPVSHDGPEAQRAAEEGSPSTYFPAESDEEVPDLDLGWPEVTAWSADTSISLLFNPPRQNTPTIKEVVRRQIQDAKQVIAVAMDVFTDIDIFKEIVGATLRGVVVYILLDDSQFQSFLIMSERLGIRIQDFKNIRVRTVKGQQYRCQSGVRFHGSLEQRFILVDCKTVIYGTYSFMWSFEKINLSMVLVITGELVGSYDEEFRLLFARSAIPDALTRERASGQLLRDALSPRSPHSSQLSIRQIHMRSRVTHGLRSTKDEGTINGASLTRGQSMQERLHLSHHPDEGNLVRVHSYAGELQRFNSSTQLRMVPRNGRIPGARESNGSNLWLGDDQQPTGRAAQFHHRHRSRYGADQHLIPFNSETSLHRWKMDSYFSNNLPYDMSSPHNSQFSLNENQSQLIPGRLRDIKSKLEEIRLKRHSLQGCIDPRQSQEALKSAFSTLDRCKEQSSLRALEMREAIAELEQDRGLQYSYTLEPTYHRARGTPKLRHELVEDSVDKENERQPPPTQIVLSNRYRPSSHYDMKTALERKTLQTYDFHESLARTPSAAELDVKLKEPSLMRPGGTQHSRAMGSLLEIPEEKDVIMQENSGSATKLAHISGLTALKDMKEKVPKERRNLSRKSTH
ncbi:protein FAM83B-like [Lampris incognitus]|uniref:protein FAM83B-like n=1 Tax=Lampris incognitus TaxID=2546036 RepID=UPI0024B60AFC|nr:protein FAM83B-like [Lampris incognitus]